MKKLKDFRKRTREKVQAKISKKALFVFLVGLFAGVSLSLILLGFLGLLIFSWLIFVLILILLFEKKDLEALKKLIKK